MFKEWLKGLNDALERREWWIGAFLINVCVSVIVMLVLRVEISRKTLAPEPYCSMRITVIDDEIILEKTNSYGTSSRLTAPIEEGFEFWVGGCPNAEMVAEKEAKR